MAFESEILKRDDIKVGGVYRKELLDFYAIDFRSMLVIPDSPPNIFFSDTMSDYSVIEIIDNCYVITAESRVASHVHYDKIIIIKKV